jgi:hypothetical protein
MSRIKWKRRKEKPRRRPRPDQASGRQIRRKAASKLGRSRNGLGPASGQSALLHLQQVHGNAFVSRYLAQQKNAGQNTSPGTSAQKPEPSSVAQIENLAGSASSGKTVAVSLAGKPVAKGPEGGMAEILSKSSGGTIGVAGGLTIAYDDFKEPKLKVDVESKGEGEKEQFFAKIQSTSTKDAVHDSYYPGPGLHKRPGMTQTVGDKTFQYYWKIKPKIAQLIKKGEQEHLNDHKRAFELTYGRVTKTINKLADKKIGPAKTAAAAKKKALARLAKALPAKLGVSPEKWHKTLIRLLKATEHRDRKQWHALDSEGPMKTVDTKRITVVGKARTTKIGKVLPKKVVKL